MKAIAWLKKWGGLVGGFIVAILLGILTLGWYTRRKNAEVAQLTDKLAVEEATTEIEKLRAIRGEIVARVGEQDEAVEEIDRQLAENKRKMVEAHKGVEALSDEEIEDEFARLGF